MSAGNSIYKSHLLVGPFRLNVSNRTQKKTNIICIFCSLLAVNGLTEIDRAKHQIPEERLIGAKVLQNLVKILKNYKLNVQLYS